MSPVPPLTSADPAPRRPGLAAALAILALLPIVVWPGDVAWLLDEPRLIAMAWHANHDGILTTAGLAGNFGVRYGPLAVQIYQALLLITHDPSVVVILRGLLCGGATMAGLLWLARVLRLPAWFAAAILIAPLVSAYQRVLWDASFAIPLGTLALAGLAEFVSSGRAWAMRICAVTAVLVPLIHPQGLPLFVAIAGYLAWRHRDALWQDRLALLGLGAAVLALHAVYFVLAAGDAWWRLWHGTTAAYPGVGSRWLSALAPFLGGNLLAGVAAVRQPLPEPAFTLALWASRAFYPIVWLGITLTTPRAIAAARAGRGITPRDTLALVALAGLAMQALLFGALRIPCAPQYFFGTFPLHVLPAWLALDALRRWRIGLVLGILHGAGGAALTLGTMLTVHREGYVETGWPRLRDSVEVALALNRFTDTIVQTDVPFYAQHSEPLRTLRLLLPPIPGEKTRPSGRLLITRRTSDVVDIDEVTLVELPANAPAQGTPIDVTPLPRNYVPAPETW